MRSAGQASRPRRRLVGLLFGLGLVLLPVATLQANVTLVRFEAAASAERVQLTWETATEYNTAGYFVERSLSPTNGFAQASEVMAATGNGPTGAIYTWEDQRVQRGTTYYYRLIEIESNQQLFQHPQVVCASPGRPTCRVSAAAPSATVQPSAPPPNASPSPRPPDPTAQTAVQPTTPPPAPSRTPTRRPSAPGGQGGAAGDKAAAPTQAPAAGPAKAGATTIPATEPGAASSPPGARSSGSSAAPPSSGPAPNRDPALGGSGGEGPNDTRPDSAPAGSAPVVQPAAGSPGGTQPSAGMPDAAANPQVALQSSAATPAAARGPAGSAARQDQPGSADAQGPPLRWLWVGLIGLAFLFVARRVVRLTRQG